LVDVYSKAKKNIKVTFESCKFFLFIRFQNGYNRPFPRTRGATSVSGQTLQYTSLPEWQGLERGNCQKTIHAFGWKVFEKQGCKTHSNEKNLTNYIPAIKGIFQRKHRFRTTLNSSQSTLSVLYFKRKLV
jgi:hypothetical protein